MCMHSFPPCLASGHRQGKLNEQERGLEGGKVQAEHVCTWKKLERVQSGEWIHRQMRENCDPIQKDLPMWQGGDSNSIVLIGSNVHDYFWWWQGCNIKILFVTFNK